MLKVVLYRVCLRGLGWESLPTAECDTFLDIAVNIKLCPEKIPYITSSGMVRYDKKGHEDAFDNLSTQETFMNHYAYDTDLKVIPGYLNA